MTSKVVLPGLDCGMCGFRTCVEFEAELAKSPELIERCVYIDANTFEGGLPGHAPSHVHKDGCHGCNVQRGMPDMRGPIDWKDSLGREFDFMLDKFPEEPGPREIIIPHNPMLTREMDIQVGETLIGRPLGMSCGCPVTHCGIVTEVDRRTGVMSWCVTGPLGPREHGFKDLGYYIAEGYEGLIVDTRCELKLGMRHYFMPRLCMLQWRHSGLINYLNRTPDGWQVRVEGLWIG